jgi:hypothetical protein
MILKWKRRHHAFEVVEKMLPFLEYLHYEHCDGCSGGQMQYIRDHYLDADDEAIDKVKKLLTPLIIATRDIALTFREYIPPFSIDQALQGTLPVFRNRIMFEREIKKTIHDQTEIFRILVRIVLVYITPNRWWFKYPEPQQLFACDYPYFQPFGGWTMPQQPYHVMHMLDESDDSDAEE